MKIIANIYARLEEGLIVICLAFMTVMNFVNVVSRYLFTNSFSFTEELTIMAFVWVTMLGISVGYKRVAHLGMSFVVDLCPKKLQALLILLSMACSLVMIVILIKEGFVMVEGQILLNSKTPALRLPSATQGLAIPVGGILIAVRTLTSGIGEFRRKLGEDMPTEETGGTPIC